MRLFLVLLCLVASARPAAAARLDFSTFAALPVQHDGRLQPLDSFARNFLIQFSGSDHLGELPACKWLAMLLFSPEQGYKQAVFDVPNPSVRNALGLPARPAHYYSFIEISAGFAAHRDTLAALLPRQGEPGLDPAQKQLLALYTNTLWYFEISRSLSLVLPEFSVDDAKLAAAIGVPAARPFDYLDFLPHRPAYLALALPALRSGRTPSADILQIGAQLQRMDVDKQSRVFRVVPPQWAGNGDSWLSPWSVLQTGNGSPVTTELFAAWRRLGTDYRAGDAAAWDKDGQALYALTAGTDGWRLRLEAFYNMARIFPISLGCYILSFLLLLGSAAGFGRAAFWHRAAFAALSAGALLHLIGLGMRVTVMARPPVGTLYESVLFVGMIVVLTALALEARTKAGIGLLIGALAGAVLQFIGLRYAGAGDTMSPLVAVLNTNFWLATHVVCVTIGYGASLVTGLLGHLWLLQAMFRRDDAARQAVTGRAMIGGALVALLFATTGTILGGIWADQSWGRFWGWDPKENGALLIVLWLLWLLHGRLSGLLTPLPFAAGAAATTIVVALSWFGVNLLGVGLHSYGFTAGIAANLFAFCFGEAVLIGGSFLYLRRRTVAVS